MCFLSLEHSSSRRRLLATSTHSVLLKDPLFSKTVSGHPILTACPLLTFNTPSLPLFVSTALTTVWPEDGFYLLPLLSVHSRPPPE